MNQMLIRARKSVFLATGISLLAMTSALAGEVTVWSWDPNFNGATMKEAAARYSASHPDMTINLVDFAKADLEQKLQAQLASTAVEGYGFSAEEVGGITDARAVQVLYDAAQWRALQAGKAMAKKAPEAPRTVKPVARAADQVGVNRQKQLQQAKRTGKVEDFVGLLFK